MRDGPGGERTHHLAPWGWGWGGRAEGEGADQSTSLTVPTVSQDPRPNLPIRFSVISPSYAVKNNREMVTFYIRLTAAAPGMYSYALS